MKHESYVDVKVVMDTLPEKGQWSIIWKYGKKTWASTIKIKDGNVKLYDDDTGEFEEWLCFSTFLEDLKTPPIYIKL